MYLINLFKNLVYKNFLPILIVNLIMFMMVVFVTHYNTFNINIHVIKPILTISRISNYSFLDSVLILIQISSTIFVSYTFFSYELDNSKEFFSLRTNIKKLFLSKLIIMIILILTLRTIYYFYTLLLFNLLNQFSITDLFISVFIYIIIVYITFIVFLINFKVKKNYN